jgi:hypothetical protein
MERTGLPMVLKVRVRCFSIGISSTLILATVANGQIVNRPLSTTTADSSTPTSAQGARAESLSYGVDVGIGESDNVTLVETNKVSQTMAVADIDFDFKDQSRRFDIDAKGDFTHLNYLQNAYSNQLLGRFDGSAAVALIPEHLNWVVRDNYGQGQIDPFEAVTPNNLENINYAATGPDVAFRFGPTVFLDLSARYARVTYENQPFDRNEMLGSAALGRVLSPQSSISINASFERALFDNTVVNTDFDRSSIYAHYEVQGARTVLGASLGVTRVDQDSQSFTGPDAQLQLSRVLSPTSKLTLAVGRDLTDAGTAFANLYSGALGGIVTGPGALSLNNYTATYGSIRWDYAHNRTTIAASGSWEKDSYQDLPLQDLTRGGAEFRVERRLSRVMTAELQGRIFRTDYINTEFSETDGLVGAALTFREGRGLEIKLRYEHSSRVVSGPGTGYQENRAFLTVGYRPRTVQST